MNLPPGFHFSPTDEELILHYLAPMAANLPCLPNIIPHLHLSLFHPSQFNGKALSSGDQFYFFTSCKSNRVTKSGYWKEMGVTEPIVSISSGKCVGLKKYLEFIINDDKDSQVQNNNTETSWVMQEYHLCSYNEFNNTTSDKSSTTRGTRKLPKNKGEKQSKWVLCRVYERNRNSEADHDDDDDGSLELSWADQVFMSLDDDDDDDEISFPN